MIERTQENKIFRLGGDFVKVNKPNFEVSMVNIFRNWYFKKYFIHNFFK